MNDGFYRAFEERYRGTRDLIKNRAWVYLPLLRTLHQMSPEPKALDLGCGRGEWLEILKEHGVAGKGVDIDDNMLDAAREHGLDVITKEALEYLKCLPSENLTLISAFHLVEHLPFSDLRILVEQSLRVLKPGGILILETPNPENIAVGTSDFYLDPTHQRPIPPQLLSFIPEYYGYSRIKIMRLQESVELTGSSPLTLMNVIEGVSPDYAVVAQKSADPDLLRQTDDFFEQDYGLTLGSLVSKYDHQIQDRSAMEDMIVQQAKDCAAHAEARAVNAEQLAARIREDAQIANQRACRAEADAAEANQRTGRAEADAAEANQRADQLQAWLTAVYASRSWKITGPLRNASTLLSFLVRQPRRMLRALLVFSMGRVLSRPGMKRLLMNFLWRFPRLRNRLQIIALGSGLIDSSDASIPPDLSLSRDQSVNPDPADMTPTARGIYEDLKKALENRCKGNE